MFKKFTFLAFSIGMLLLCMFSEVYSQGTPTPMGPYNWGTYYGYVQYSSYFFTANRNFNIVRVNVPNEYGGNQPQSVEIYRLNTQPTYSWQWYYDDVFYPWYSPNYTPLWSVRAWGGGNGPVPINQGSAYPGGTIQYIPITSGQSYLVVGNIGNYYQSCYYGYGWVTNISGTPLQLWPAYIYNGYYMYSYWSYYGYMNPYVNYPMGRTVLYYTVPIYIYTVQAAGGTISPAGTAGPFSEGDNVNLNYTVTPNPGREIVSVLINGAPQSPISRPIHTQHFGVITSDQTITAVFGYKVTSTGYGAFITPPAASYYAAGTNPSFSTTPFPGATISSIVATPQVGPPVNIAVLNGGLGQTIALGQPNYPFANISQNWTLDVICVMNLFTSIEPHGTINPLGSSDILYGTQFPVRIIPDANYKVNNLYVDGFDVLDPTQPGYPRAGLDFSEYPIITYTIDMSYSHTVNATFYAYEITPVVVGIGGVITPPDPVRVYEHAQYPFVITPDLDYHIDTVKAINLSTGDITIYDNLPLHGEYNALFRDIMNDWRLEAQFTIDRFNVIVKNARIIEGGKIFPTGTLNPESDDGLVIVNSGTDLNFTITADLGWNIKDVILDGHEIEAQFQKIEYTITATAGNHGVITLDGWELPAPANGEYKVYYGDNSRFVVTPDHGYKISELKVDGNVVNPEPEYTFYYVTENHTITATFAPTNRYTITATAGTGGTISPSGAVSVIEGDDQQFTWTPNQGYEIADVLIDGESQGKITEHTFGNVNADHTIEIIFNPIITYGLQCTLDATQVVSGQPFNITVTCIDQANQQPVNPPTAVNLTVSAAGGSQGTLSGTMQGTIPTNDNKVTITGIVYTNNSGEANVQLVTSAAGMADCMIT
ncbi:MAG: hypothetical protein HZB41_11995, partial [Ignavibacteriae bacterium]|nr:hypothetical protein [Ignavibacteriota bacterium]